MRSFVPCDMGVSLPTPSDTAKCSANRRIAACRFTPLCSPICAQLPMWGGVATSPHQASGVPAAQAKRWFGCSVKLTEGYYTAAFLMTSLQAGSLAEWLAQFGAME
jgi:hypothetical protein